MNASSPPDRTSLTAPSLSVIIPVLDGEGWIGQCLHHLGVAIERSGLAAVEVIVIDDGSTDRTRAEVESSTLPADGVPVRVLSQPNLGRFAARRRGLDVAVHPFVLLIDTRVFIRPEALEFVAERLTEPGGEVWTSHVEAATDGNPLAGFWQAIEHVAWRRYFTAPRTMRYGLEDFDYYPKGTTALIARRDLIIDAFDAFVPTVTDWRKVNDDTAVLRWIAERVGINISPQYASTYNARTSLEGFLRHAEHRGTVLIDGYLRPGARFAGPIVLVLASTPLVLWSAIRHPIRSAVLAAGGSIAAGGAVRRLGARSADARVLGTYAVPFGIAYLIGMWRGVLLRLRSPGDATTRPVDDA